VRSPAERYIKYLLLSSTRSNNDIRNIILKKGLDFPGTTYVQTLREACIPNKPFYPEDLNHKESQSFLKAHGLFFLFNPDGAMLDAEKLLAIPRAKEIVEALLISRSEPFWISKNLKRSKFSFTALAIERYAEHFFDLNLVDNSDLKALMSVRGLIADETTDEDQDRLLAQRAKAMKLDVRLQAANAHIGPLAAIANQVKLGMLPSNIELGKLVSANRSMAIVASLEACLNGWGSTARDFALTAKMMTEILEQVGVAEKDLQDSLIGLAMAHTTEQTPTLKELSGGNHSADMQVLNTENLEIETDAIAEEIPE